MKSPIRLFVLALAILSVHLCSAGCREPSFGDQLSTKQEVEIGRQASEQVESQFPGVADAASAASLEAIAAKVTPVAKLARGAVDYHVRLLKSDDEDAFSLPGGWIYIDEGLIQKIGGDKDALACVVAHEAAHVVLRHSAIELSNAYGNDGLIDLLTEGKYQEAANISLQLAHLSHSNQDEIDADRVGEKIAKVAGYDPAGMLRFLALMQVTQAPEGSWLSTHPVSKNRQRHLNEDIDDLRAGKY